MEYRTLEEWSFEQAQEDDRAFDGSEPEYRRPIFRFLAFRSLEVCLAEYNESKNGRTIMDAIAVCAHNDIVMPTWLAQAYLDRFRLVSTYQVDSWDTAFNNPFPKGTHLNALRKKWKLEIQVWNKAHETLQLEPQTPIDKALFERIGRPLGIGATLAEEYYYSVSRRFSRTKTTPTPRRRKLGRTKKSRK